MADKVKKQFRIYFLSSNSISRCVNLYGDTFDTFDEAEKKLLQGIPKAVRDYEFIILPVYYEEEEV